MANGNSDCLCLMPAVICHRSRQEDRQVISGRGPIVYIPGSRIPGYDRSSGDDRWYRARVAIANHAGGPARPTSVVWDLSQRLQSTTMGLEGSIRSLPVYPRHWIYQIRILKQPGLYPDIRPGLSLCTFCLDPGILWCTSQRAQQCCSIYWSWTFPFLLS